MSSSSHLIPPPRINARPCSKTDGVEGTLLSSAHVSLRTRIGIRPGKQASGSVAVHGCRGVKIETLETDLQICRLFTLT